MPQAIKNKNLQFAKTLAKYAGKWIALQVKEKRIIAFGNTLREVQEKLSRSKERDYAFHLVEKYPLAMYEIPIHPTLASWFRVPA